MGGKPDHGRPVGCCLPGGLQVQVQAQGVSQQDPAFGQLPGRCTTPPCPPGNAGQALVEKLLLDVCEAACKLDSLAGEADHDAVTWMREVLGPLVLHPPQPAQLQALLGKGSQGHVHQACATDGQVFARKVCVLTASQVEEGGVMVGLQDMVHAARCCMAVVKPSLLHHLPRYIACHMQPLQDVRQHFAGPSLLLDGERSAGVLLTIDMELLSCNLTHYARTRLHRVVCSGALAAASAAAGLVGTPLGTRLLPVAPLFTITHELLQGLRALHRTGMLHCDIKPDNVLLGLAPGSGGIQAVKLGDFGASCLMDAYGNTEEARLATLSYQHHEKKCMRYEAQHAHHSSQRFDLTELCASLLEVCLGLCPRTQLRSWLVCTPLHELLLDAITEQEAHLRSWQSPSQAKYLAAMQHVAQQGHMGQAYIGLIRVLTRGWSSGGHVGIDALLAELQSVAEMYGVSCAGGASLEHSPSASVLLDGGLFPLPVASLDALFSDVTPQQVLAMSCVHPDAWEQYHAYLNRQLTKAAAQQRAAALAAAAQRRQGPVHPTPAEAIPAPRALSGAKLLSAPLGSPTTAGVVTQTQAAAALMGSSSITTTSGSVMLTTMDVEQAHSSMQASPDAAGIAMHVDVAAASALPSPDHWQQGHGQRSEQLLRANSTAVDQPTSSCMEVTSTEASSSTCAAQMVQEPVALDDGRSFTMAAPEAHQHYRAPEGLQQQEQQQQLQVRVLVPEQPQQQHEPGMCTASPAASSTAAGGTDVYAAGATHSPVASTATNDQVEAASEHAGTTPRPAVCSSSSGSSSAEDCSLTVTSSATTALYHLNPAGAPSGLSYLSDDPSLTLTLTPACSTNMLGPAKSSNTASALAAPYSSLANSVSLPRTPLDKPPPSPTMCCSPPSPAAAAQSSLLCGNGVVTAVVGPHERPHAKCCMEGRDASQPTAPASSRKTAQTTKFRRWLMGCCFVPDARM